jgi:hypothetical protein
MLGMVHVEAGCDSRNEKYVRASRLITSARLETN